jgi:DNA/RNA endonuclease YhcR with UshA esterase domain
LHKEVDLEKDITDKDQYERSLRYVWLDNKFVNAEIVRAGVAIAKQYDPDIKYQRIIADAEHEAIEKQVGCLWSQEVQSTTITVPTLTPTQTPKLSPVSSQSKTKWKSSDEGVISYLDADNYIGQKKTVEGTIVKTFKYTKGKTIFLNFHDPYQGYFTAIIWSSDWGKFPFAPEEYYKGKEVRVTGEIIEYKGSPEIVVRDPSQIEVVYPKTKAVAATARHLGDVIHVTYMGGPDHDLVTGLSCTIGQGSFTDFTDTVVGRKVSQSGFTGTNNHVVVIATFSDGTSQVILDMYC